MSEVVIIVGPDEEFERLQSFARATRRRTFKRPRDIPPDVGVEIPWSAQDEEESRQVFASLARRWARREHPGRETR